MIYDLMTLQGIVNLVKDFLPWLVIAGGSIRWWFAKKNTEETTGLQRIETLSKIEERLRAGLQKQLELTESKLGLANIEIERLKVLIHKYEIEVSNLREEIERYRRENSK